MGIEGCWRSKVLACGGVKANVAGGTKTGLFAIRGIVSRRILLERVVVASMILPRWFCSVDYEDADVKKATTEVRESDIYWSGEGIIYTPPSRI